MSKLDLNFVITNHYPNFEKISNWKKQLILGIVKRVIHLDEINKVLETNSDTYGVEFIDNLFEQLNFSFNISNKDLRKIPSEGRLIIVANHPIGSLDGLALLKLISEIREDVKIIANSILYEIENLRNLFLPFNLDSKLIQRENIKSIDEALQNEHAIIIFPAAEVSRLKFYHITDSKWHKGAIHFAKKNNSPILPIYIDAKNSLLFYLASAINKYFSRFLLVHELFNKKNKTISIKVGNPIPAKVFTSHIIEDQSQIALLKKHVMRIRKDRKGVFVTEKNIIHPIPRKFIKRELINSELLGETSDRKKIYLCEYSKAPNTLNEIARLREITFRKVGEGTGNKLDIDRFDKIYKHIVVWDENDLEIVGAYRLGLGSELMNEFGIKGFYTSTLFKYSEDFINTYLNSSLELGRSFIQKKYWKTNALHYLWQGIGAFLYKHPEIKYMFGGVSISKNYNQTATEMIVFYYSKWYGNIKDSVHPNKEFKISEKTYSNLSEEFIGNSPIEDYKILKNMLKPFGFTVPTLYKQYTDLCEIDGVKYLGFGVDDSFEMCVDGFILIDVEKITKEKRLRYIDVHSGEQAVA
ncbi:MAG: lysophospholipid acyltransferase family protein [Ignavibacteriae bacterium]|nr:lysophospholipid acyltransferase family protein [Ignavibacteriota bacterium]